MKKTKSSKKIILKITMSMTDIGMPYREPGTQMHCLGLLSELSWITRLVQVILGRIGYGDVF